eukprot:3576819-Rhodomonas_salina.1
MTATNFSLLSAPLSPQTQDHSSQPCEGAGRGGLPHHQPRWEEERESGGDIDLAIFHLSNSLHLVPSDPFENEDEDEGHFDAHHGSIATKAEQETTVHSGRIFGVVSDGPVYQSSTSGSTADVKVVVGPCMTSANVHEHFLASYAPREPGALAPAPREGRNEYSAPLNLDTANLDSLYPSQEHQASSSITTHQQAADVSERLRTSASWDSSHSAWSNAGSIAQYSQEYQRGTSSDAQAGAA